VRILVRADSGFAREELMAWCEANGVHFRFGLAKNNRLIAEIKTELDQAAVQSRRTDLGPGAGLQRTEEAGPVDPFGVRDGTCNIFGFSKSSNGDTSE
jgi:hypothetical protein